MTDMRFEMTRTKARSEDHLAFRLLVALTYPLFLAAAILSRLVPAGSGFLARPTDRVSIFTQARRSSEATIAFAFMG
ncbi:MAG: hypothetical protein NTZ14_18180 [Hyphomicrobiales bacterium]|jgi:hypothetical protein|nr:hypothetical protein [Hyphomicrobiales bacterium]